MAPPVDGYLVGWLGDDDCAEDLVIKGGDVFN